MLIRSQDKKTIINMDNITQIYKREESNTVSAIFISKSFENLGTYSTKAKAIKILDMI